MLMGKPATEAHREVAALKQQHMGLKMGAGKLTRYAVRCRHSCARPGQALARQHCRFVGMPCKHAHVYVRSRLCVHASMHAFLHVLHACICRMCIDVGRACMQGRDADAAQGWLPGERQR